MANFCCSIELEPRTLKQGQLNHVREIAADAAQKTEQREFSSISIRGLREMEEIKENGTQFQPDRVLIDQSKKKDQTIENPCQCSCSIVNNESPDDGMDSKEPVTAPF